MPHDPTARRAATLVPLVLFGANGRTVEGYRPADEDLDHARPARSHKVGGGVIGPHLRVARTKHARNRTGIVGISFSYDRARRRHFIYVQLGARHRRFCIDTLGRAEAWRRAVQLRREHVRKLTLANAVILHARDRNLSPVNA